MRPLPGFQLFPRHLLQRGLSAQNGPGQGRALKDRRGQPFGAQILRVVGVHPHLLQNDAPLGGHVALVEFGAEEHVAEDVGGLGKVGVQHPGVVDGVFLGGVGVELAADGVHLLGQPYRGAPGGPLEGHVLDKMGRAAESGGLPAGAHAHPDPQGGGADAGDMLSEQADAVGKNLSLVHHFDSSYHYGMWYYTPFSFVRQAAKGPGPPEGARRGGGPAGSSPPTALPAAAPGPARPGSPRNCRRRPAGERAP